ncbi:MAG: imelysin family protein [Chthoniobacterales bacterium]
MPVILGKRPQTLPLAVAGVCALILAGCQWEVSEVPLPRPDPTPSPSPTPEVQFAESSRVATSASEVTLEEQVAVANADLVTSATSAAVGEATAFERATRRLAVAPVSSAGDWATARESLAAAKRAYRKTEAAIFYVDPESPDELAAQPDPFGAAAAALDASHAFAEVDRRLAKLGRLTAGATGGDVLGEVIETLSELAAWSGRLRTDLQSLADAWDPAAAAGFREKYFLASPEHAVARIFQGLLAQSGDVLPRRLVDRALAPAEVSGRTDALQDLYLGITEEYPEGRGPHDLVFAVAPAQAMATYGAIAQAVAWAEALALAPGNSDARRQLQAALEQATRQLELAASALGIRIVDGPE